MGMVKMVQYLSMKKLTHKQAYEQALRLSKRDGEPYFIYEGESTDAHNPAPMYYAWSQLSIDLGYADKQKYTGVKIDYAMREFEREIQIEDEF